MIKIILSGKKGQALDLIKSAIENALKNNKEITEIMDQTVDFQVLDSEQLSRKIEHNSIEYHFGIISGVFSVLPAGDFGMNSLKSLRALLNR